MRADKLGKMRLDYSIGGSADKCKIEIAILCLDLSRDFSELNRLEYSMHILPLT